jgi:hypothetical protein
MEEQVMALLELKSALIPLNARAFTVADLKLLLNWKRVKLGLPAASAKKADLLTAYFANPPPIATGGWSGEEEMELLALQSEAVDMKDTAIGVAMNQMARAVAQNMANVDPDTAAQLREALDMMDATIPVNGI